MTWILLALLAFPASAAIEARSDARVDLMGLVELLAGTRPPPTPLAERALKRFAPYAGHSVVLSYAKMRAKGFAGNIPTQYALYLSDLPELKVARPVPELFATLAGGRPALLDFTRDLRLFAAESGFAAWRQQERAALEEPAETLRSVLAARDLEAPVVELLGLKLWRRWTALGSPFYPWSYGSDWVIEETGERTEIVSIVGAPLAGLGPRELARRLWQEALYSAAYALWSFCAPRDPPLGGGACRDSAPLREPENCVEDLWVRGLAGVLYKQEFSSGTERPASRMVRRAAQAYARRRGRYPDFLAAADLLWEPFLKKGASCRLIEPVRYAEEVYARRLYYCALAKLEKSPGAEPWAETARELKPIVEAALRVPRS